MKGVGVACGVAARTLPARCSCQGRRDPVSPRTCPSGRSLTHRSPTDSGMYECIEGEKQSVVVVFGERERFLFVSGVQLWLGPSLPILPFPSWLIDRCRSPPSCQVHCRRAAPLVRGRSTTALRRAPFALCRVSLPCRSPEECAPSVRLRLHHMVRSPCGRSKSG